MSQMIEKLENSENNKNNNKNNELHDDNMKRKDKELAIQILKVLRKEDLIGKYLLEYFQLI